MLNWLPNLKFIAHHMSHKQQSPGGQNGRASNLRLVLPTPLAQNMSAADEISYGDVSNCDFIFILSQILIFFFASHRIAATQPGITQYARGDAANAHTEYDGLHIWAARFLYEFLRCYEFTAMDHTSGARTAHGVSKRRNSYWIFKSMLGWSDIIFELYALVKILGRLMKYEGECLFETRLFK